jgi:hypothetical protein
MCSIDRTIRCERRPDDNIAFVRRLISPATSECLSAKALLLIQLVNKLYNKFVLQFLSDVTVSSVHY